MENTFGIVSGAHDMLWASPACPPSYSTAGERTAPAARVREILDAATAPERPEFIIVGRDHGDSYTLWDIAPAPTDRAKRSRAIEEITVDVMDALGEITLAHGATAREALDTLLGGKRLTDDSNASGLQQSATASGAAKSGMIAVQAAIIPGPDDFHVTGWHSYDSTADIRIWRAIRKSGFTFPSGLVTVQVTDHRNVSSTLDLAAACAILAAAGELDRDALDRAVILGELCSLTAKVNALPGVTDAASAAHTSGHRTVVVPAAQVRDVRALGLGLDVIGVRDLVEAVTALKGLAPQG